MAEEAMARLNAPARSLPRGRRHVRDYSRFVTAMKFVLPILAAGLIALLAVWSQIRIEDGRFRIGMASIAPTQIDRLSMVNPRFQGIWHLHVSRGHDELDGDKNMIANTDPDQAKDKMYNLRLRIQKNGNITVINERNGFNRTYKAGG